MNDFIFDEQQDAQESDAVTNITNIRPVSFKTPLFDFDMKTFEIGDSAVNAARGTLGVDIANAIIDKLITAIASRYHVIQKELQGIEAIANGTAKRPSEMYEGTELRDGFGKNCTVEQLYKARTAWLEIIAYNNTIMELKNQFATVFPNYSNKIQYAWATKTAADAQGMANWGAILNSKDAVQFRVKTNPTRMRDIAAFNNFRSSTKMIDAPQQVNVSEMLGA